MANRKSGKQFLKCFGDKIIRVTLSTYITEAGKVIRKKDISLRLKNPQISGRQGPSKPLLGKQLERESKLSSSSSSDEILVPRAQAQQKQLAATTRLAAQPSCSKAIPISVKLDKKVRYDQEGNDTTRRGSSIGRNRITTGFISRRSCDRIKCHTAVLPLDDR